MEEKREYNISDKGVSRGFGRGVLVGALGSFILLTLMIGIGGVLIFMFGVRLGYFSGKSSDRGKISAIDAIIDKYYIGDVKEEDLIDGMYRGMVQGTEDPYAEYYSAEEYAQEKTESTGNYSGIGATLTQDADTKSVYVVKVYEGFPAEDAGLKAGDEVISVDGHAMKDQSLDLLVQRYVRGEAGTTLSMTYRRSGKKHETKIVRGEITVPTVEYRMLDKKAGIALVEISRFENGTKDEFIKAMKALDKQGMKAVIYDMRVNPGGLVDSVTAVLDEILPSGTTVYMMDKNKKKTVMESDEARQIKIPTVILTSGNTASSAEIFTGALRDYEWGTIIGTKTYGKGVVQGTFPMVDGSAVKLTIAKYYTPKGECIDGEGIKPDIELEYKYTGNENRSYDYSKDNQVNRAIKELKKQL